MAFNQAEFEAWVDELPVETHHMVLERACIDLGWSREIGPEKVVIDGDIYSQEFMQAVHRRYKMLYVDETLNSLVDKGILVPNSVDENGHIGYVLAEGVTLDEG